MQNRQVKMYCNSSGRFAYYYEIHFNFTNLKWISLRSVFLCVSLVPVLGCFTVVGKLMMGGGGATDDAWIMLSVPERIVKFY